VNAPQYYILCTLSVLFAFMDERSVKWVGWAHGSVHFLLCFCGYRFLDFRHTNNFVGTDCICKVRDKCSCNSYL